MIPKIMNTRGKRVLFVQLAEAKPAGHRASTSPTSLKQAQFTLVAGQSQGPSSGIFAELSPLRLL
jgi:hypothetical protein